MTEQELRALVRTAIARVHVTAPLEPSHPSHASHAVFMVPDGSDAEGPCIIEPTVMCNHCGYCKSMGH
jgi:hypothetical protein